MDFFTATCACIPSRQGINAATWLVALLIFGGLGGVGIVAADAMQHAPPAPACPLRTNGIATEGTVEFYVERKGFGFIAPDDGSDNVLVHVRSLEQSGLGPLHACDRVRYDIRGRREAHALSLLQ